MAPKLFLIIVLSCATLFSMAQQPFNHKTNQKIIAEIKKDLKCKSQVKFISQSGTNANEIYENYEYGLTLNIWTKDLSQFLKDRKLNEIALSKILEKHYPLAIDYYNLLVIEGQFKQASQFKLTSVVDQRIFRSAKGQNISNETYLARVLAYEIIEVNNYYSYDGSKKDAGMLKIAEAEKLDSTLHLIPLAKAYVNRDTAKIRTLVNNGYQQYPNEEIYFRLYVRKLMSKGNLTLAESLLQKGRSLYKNETELNISYGYLFLHKKEYDKALKMAEKILDIGPFNETADLIRVISEQQLEKKK